MKRFFIISLVVASTCLASVQAQDSGGRDAIAVQYPRVDGSTSTLPLQKIIACHIYDVSWVWFFNSFENTYYVIAGVQRDQIGDLARAEGSEIINNAIRHNGTHDAYMNLISGNADFILVARAPSSDEIQAAEQAGVTLDVLPVARDAFVFLANVANPVESLALDDIRAIYTGTTTSWNTVGVTDPIADNPDNPITPYTRNPNSGSQELMESLVMQSLPMIDAPDLMQMSMMGPLNVINHDPHGLGYSVYFYASFIQPEPNVKLLGVEGVLPTSNTIADESYVLATDVYAAVRADMPDGSTAVLLRNWLTTPAGQAVIAASGYVPLMSEY